jgi:NADH-quinone oxidoreductase subunit E
LQDLQHKFGYVPRESLEAVCAYLDIKLSTLYSMATFYRALSLKPRGKHLIKVCDGTACHIRGGPVILDALERTLGIRAGETTGDGLFSLETVNCLGACAIAPVMVVDGKYHPKVKPDEVGEILKSYSKAAPDKAAVKSDKATKPTVKPKVGKAKPGKAAPKPAAKPGKPKSTKPTVKPKPDKAGSKPAKPKPAAKAKPAAKPKAAKAKPAAKPKPVKAKLNKPKKVVVKPAKPVAKSKPAAKTKPAVRKPGGKNG